jgi:hypothetical protein
VWQTGLMIYFQSISRGCRQIQDILKDRHKCIIQNEKNKEKNVQFN